MNEPMAIRTDCAGHFAPLGADGERDVPAVQEFIWEKQRRNTLQNIGGCLWSLCLVLLRPRLPEGYYRYIESIGLSRWQALALWLSCPAIMIASFKTTQHLIYNPTEIVTVARASEHYKSD